MKKCQEYNVYTFTGSGDWRFGPIIQLFSPSMNPGELIEWFSDEKTSEGNEWVSIDKERDAIALYDIGDQFEDEIASFLIDLNTKKRFEMSRKNFAEILYQWEKLRVSRPDIILVIIHEDNHISLEIDPKIIKEYQDAGHAFDINKQ